MCFCPLLRLHTEMGDDLLVFVVRALRHRGDCA
jgi:hypothetical protein